MSLKTGTTFIYCLNDPRDGRTRYLGKADNPYVRLQNHSQASSKFSTHKNHWIRGLLAAGFEPELEILEEIPHAGWQEIEREYIRVFKALNIPLTNLAPGGEGVGSGKNHPLFGKSPSLETRQKISAAVSGPKNHNFGKKFSAETRAKMSVVCWGDKHHNFGKKLPAETREKIRAANLGRKASPGTLAKLKAFWSGPDNPNRGRKHSSEVCARVSVANKGRAFSPEHIQNLRAARAGRRLSETHRLNIGLSKKGRPLSPETREKMSASAKLRRAREQEEKLQNGNHT